MKKSILILAFLPLLYNGKCTKAGKNCHKKLTFINNSNTNIIVALKFTSSGKCNLEGSTLKPQEKYEEDTRLCWENEAPIERYIIDPTKFNVFYQNGKQVFYSCDSIEIYNKVLKHYVLTVDDLKATNFVVTYP